MEVSELFGLESLQKHLSNKNNVKATVDSGIHPKLCFSEANILTATTHIAFCVPFDFAMGRELASALASGYLELQQMRKLSLNPFPPGSLVA